MSDIVKVERVLLPPFNSAGVPRRDRDGQPVEPRPEEMNEAVIVTLAPSPAQAARARMAARARAAGIAP